MKYLSLMFFWLLIQQIAFGQVKKECINQYTWQISQEQMSGIGQHTSLAKNTELKFSVDGTWEANQPIFEVQFGTWHWDDKGNLWLEFGVNKKAQKADLLTLSNEKLRFKIKKNLATYTYEWKAKME